MHWKDYLFFVENIGTRYFIMATVAFLLCYVFLRNKIAHKKIQSRFPKQNDYVREISYSICTIAIFGLVPLLLIKNPYVLPHTLYYKNISDYGWFYFFAAFPLLFFYSRYLFLLDAPADAP